MTTFIKNHYKVFLVLALILTAYAFGRWSAPQKKENLTKTSQATEANQQTDKHKKTTITTTKQPSGAETIVETITEDTDTNKQTATQDKTMNKQEIINNKPGTEIDVMSGLDFKNHDFVYGAKVSRQILGPISIGAWGLTNGTAGVSVGLTF